MEIPVLAMPITPARNVYTLPHDIQRQGHEFLSADAVRLCVTHDCADDAAGLDIKGAACRMLLAHKDSKNILYQFPKV
jgi:hypothetical protein